MDELKKLLGTKHAEIDAILKAAEDGKRLATKEENEKITALTKECDELAAQIKEQEAALAKAAEEREVIRARLREQAKHLASPANPRRIAPTQPANRSELGAPTIVVPAKYRRNRLRNFRGESAVEDAYLSGMWIKGALLGDSSARAWCEKHDVEILTQSEGTDTKGGYLVPPEFERAIIDLKEQYGVFGRNARIVRMASDSITQPRRTSGVTAYFVGENSEVTASDKGWDAVKLTARKLGALVKWSTELDEDAIISIADDLAQEIAYAFAVKEDQCGFLGTGTSTYGGISGLITECTTATATIVTATAGNTAFSTLDLVDLEAMVGKLPAFPGINPKWYIHKAGWAASMLRLADAAGGITYGELVNGVRVPRFLGYDVEFVQCMNSTLTAQTSTKGICYFGDLAMAAMMGQRRGLTLRTSADRYFEYDQLGILGTERFDINIHDVGDTSSAGAIVMLATPAS